MIELYSGVTFETLLKNLKNDEIKMLKKNIEEILKVRIHCSISESSFSNLKDFKEDDFIVHFSTPNGKFDFPEELLNECKKLFNNEVLCNISKGFEGVKEDNEWKNLFDEELSVRLLNVGFNKKELTLSSTLEFVNKHPIEELEKGYLICDSYELNNNHLIYGTKVIGKLSRNKKFKTNLEARLQAEKDGIKFINDIPHLPKNLYIDTLENREIIKKEIAENKIYWTIEKTLYDLDYTEKGLSKDKTSRYFYEKVHGKVEHVVWLYLDKKKYTLEQQSFLESIFEDYENLYGHIFLDKQQISIFLDNLDKNKVEYDLIISILNN